MLFPLVVIVLQWLTHLTSISWPDLLRYQRIVLFLQEIHFSHCSCSSSQSLEIFLYSSFYRFCLVLVFLLCKPFMFFLLCFCAPVPRIRVSIFGNIEQHILLMLAQVRKCIFCIKLHHLEFFWFELGNIPRYFLLLGFCVKKIYSLVTSILLLDV